MGFRSDMLAGQSNTVISWSANYLDVVLALWAGAKVLLEKEISISIKLVGRWNHNMLQNFLVDGCIDFRLDNTQWTNPSRCHCSLNHHMTVETSHWTSSNMDPVPLHSSSRLWDLDFQMKYYICFHLKRGLWTTEQQSSLLFSLAQVSCF